MTVTKAMCAPNAPLVNTLARPFELAPAAFEDACTRAAQLYLARSDPPTPPPFILTLNRQAFVSQFPAVHGPIEGPAARLHGRELLGALAERIKHAFETAGVPPAQAAIQAEIIAAQLGREPVVTAGATLGDVRAEQRVWQQAIDVTIDGSDVYVHKTITYVTPEDGVDALAPLVPLVPLVPDKPLPLARVVEVTMLFSAKRVPSGVARPGPRVTSASAWAIEARVAYAAVRERRGANDADTREALKRAYGVPTPGWWRRLLEQLKLALGGMPGIVFDESHPGETRPPHARADLTLAGVAEFEEHASRLDAWQRKPWGNGRAAFALAGVTISHRGVPILGAERLYPEDTSADQITRKVAERGSLICQEQYDQLQKEREVAWGAQIPTASLRYGEMFVRGERPRCDEAASRAQAKRDLGRALRANPAYLTINGSAPVAGTPACGAYLALREWKRLQAASGGATPLPPDIIAQLKAVGMTTPGFTPNDLDDPAFASRPVTAKELGKIEEALVNAMTETVLTRIEADFSDGVMRQDMLEAVSQTGEGGMFVVLKAHGAIEMQHVGGRNIRIRYDRPASGGAPPIVTLEYHWDLEYPSPTAAYFPGIVWGGGHGSEPEEIESARLTAFSAWRLTPRGFGLCEARFNAQVVAVWPEDADAAAHLREPNYDAAAGIYEEAAARFTQQQQHRLAAKACLRAAKIRAEGQQHAQAAALYEAAALAFERAGLTAQAQQALSDAAAARLQAAAHATVARATELA
nr:hypothetical protein [Pandoraea sputorum]